MLPIKDVLRGGWTWAFVHAYWLIVDKKYPVIGDGKELLVFDWKTAQTIAVSGHDIVGDYYLDILQMQRLHDGRAGAFIFLSGKSWTNLSELVLGNFSEFVRTLPITTSVEATLSINAN